MKFLEKLKSITKIDRKAMSLGEMAPVAIAFVVIAVTLGIGANVLSSVQSTQTANGFAYNASGYGLSSVNTLSSWLPTIAVVVAAALVIGIITTYMYFKNR